MGDHFVLLVNRLLTESTIEAAVESRKQFQTSAMSAREAKVTLFSSHLMDGDDVYSSPRKSSECRICHEEDEDSNMEIPCSCSGSLKYAHRTCIQMWCNEKGDTVCEICRQQFRPGYTAPPPLFHSGGILMNFRENWEVSRRDMHDPYFMAMLSRNQNFMESNFEDYAVPSPGSLLCCRIVALTFTLLLVLRHLLPLILDRSGVYSYTLLMLSLLTTFGILLLIYVMTFQHRRLRQDLHGFPLSTSDEESELPQHQRLPYLA